MDYGRVDHQAGRLLLGEEALPQQRLGLHAQGAGEVVEDQQLRPPLSGEELARHRVEHPDEAWVWTRESQDAIPHADECQAADVHGVIYDGDEELQAGLDQLDGPDADV